MPYNFHPRRSNEGSLINIALLTQLWGERPFIVRQSLLSGILPSVRVSGGYMVDVQEAIPTSSSRRWRQ
ncbi:hypothetical protein SAMN05444166_0202 [Singulisphaera sp. GP187]|nr:hypothetical protein SAMN05444166_0202 [Singulisphaera sp. GP187]